MDKTLFYVVIDEVSFTVHEYHISEHLVSASSTNTIPEGSEFYYLATDFNSRLAAVDSVNKLNKYTTFNKSYFEGYVDKTALDIIFTAYKEHMIEEVREQYFKGEDIDEKEVRLYGAQTEIYSNH